MNRKQCKWIVSVRCLTFNHAPYILDAMNGFTMQQTTFPYVCCIIDDASTDGEAEVIQKYLQENFDLEDRTVVRNEETDNYVLCFAQHKTNKNCYFAVLWLKFNHYSIKKAKKPYLVEWDNNAKYIAMCEGDDYWIDPLKLQKQVDFLESHPDYGVVHTNRYNLKDNKLLKVKARTNYDAVSVLLRTGIATLTACYRSDLYFNYRREIQPETKGWLMGDSPLWKYMAFNSKIHLLPDYTAVYRVLEESASHSKSIEKKIAFENSVFEIQLFIWNIYVKGKENSDRVKCQIISNHNLRVFDIYMAYGYKKKAVDYLKKNIKDLIIWDLLKISELRKIVSAVVSVQ